MTTFEQPYEYLDGVVAQTLNLPGLPPAITLAGAHYRRRTHLHCTVIAVKKAVPLLVAAGASRDAAEARVLEVVAQGLAAAKPRLTGFTADLRIVSLPDAHKQTVVVMAKVEGFDAFFAFVNEQLNLDLPTQPSHVTLYAVENLPIGLNSASEVESRTRPLTPLELGRWKDQVDTTKVLGVAL